MAQSRKLESHHTDAGGFPSLKVRHAIFRGLADETAATYALDLPPYRGLIDPTDLDLSATIPNPTGRTETWSKVSSWFADTRMNDLTKTGIVQTEWHSHWELVGSIEAPGIPSEWHTFTELAGLFEREMRPTVVHIRFDPPVPHSPLIPFLKEIQMTAANVSPRAVELLREEPQLAIAARDVLVSLGQEIRSLGLLSPPDADAFSDPDADGPPIFRIVVRAPEQMEWEDQMRAWDRLSEFVSGRLPNSDLKRRIAVSIEPG